MAYQHSPELEKLTKNNNIYFTVNWSQIRKADKYLINSSVPSMSGVYELYYSDPYGKLVLHQVDLAWYGGLRARLRRLIDPELEEDLDKRAFIENKKFYFRYCLSENYKDMQDVVFFLGASANLPKEQRSGHSGRYDKVYLKETSPNKVTSI